ncbi:MAG TPA: autotransporter, partial [Treponemataceae bacterium]|nr:autotransporter [Treponemataceae bacterium]
MKKALVVFLALALVAGVFADEPKAEAAIAGFSGNASVTWGVDLDAKKTGFSNDASAELKVTLATGGDKTSAGDGVWGEIKIKTDGLISKNDGWDKNGSASVDFAKLHLGPVYVGITSGNTQIGEYNAPRALAYETTKVPNVGENKEKGIVIGYSAG